MKKIALFIFILVGFVSAKADIKLPALVGDHMVLQRGKPINIWGKASPNEKIAVSFANKKYIATTNSKGSWRIKLPSMKAGGPYTMKLQGNNLITVKDILIGDVWICSGQSNMEFPLFMADGAGEEIKKSQYPGIRLFTVDKKITLKPADDTKGAWAVCNAETAKNFSAIGYFFGRDVHKKISVPIGLINSSWGGTVIESWISSDALIGEPTFGPIAQTVARFDTAAYNQKQRRLHSEWVKNLNNRDTGLVDNKYIWAKDDLKDEDWQEMILPTVWEFNGMAMDGIVWFRKDILLDKAHLNTSAELNLGVIQNADVTFINGVQVGRSPDMWGFSRNYKIPPGILKEGRNTIVVRVENYGGDGGFTSKPAELRLLVGTKFIPIDGKWKYRIGYKLTTNDRPEKEISPNTLPTLMYNSMVHPLINLSVKGVIWYQGESNWFRGYQYRDLFPRMINNWRSKFNQGDFPFLFVQLANHHNKLTSPGDSYWAEVREAQVMTLKLRNTGMVTAIDVGDAGNIHPTNKEEVGRRLALVAKRDVYQLPAFAYGPTLASYKVNNKAILIYFNNTVNGLKTKDNKAPGNFQIAGDDKKFHWATAEIIDEKTIKVSSENVPNPVAVRYAWEDNPSEANLINSTNLPAFPFRTDNRNGITVGNK